DYTEILTAYSMTIAAPGNYPRALHLVWAEHYRDIGDKPQSCPAGYACAKRYNIYYARTDDAGATWKNSTGTAYNGDSVTGAKIDTTEAEKVFDSFAVDTDNDPATIQMVNLCDVQLDDSGNLYILAIITTERDCFPCQVYTCASGNPS